MSEGVDTAIVGAGIVGLATAHALCRDGAGSVALFDRSWPGSGDSGRSFSMVRRHYSNAVVARLAIEGSRTIRDWADEVGVADAGFARCGYLLTVPERLVDACRGNIEMLKGLGLDTSFVTPDEIAEIEPEISTDGVAGAAYEPEGGFADAQKMCLGWFAAAASRGLQHHLGSAPQGLRQIIARLDHKHASRARASHGFRNQRETRHLHQPLDLFWIIGTSVAREAQPCVFEKAARFPLVHRHAQHLRWAAHDNRASFAQQDLRML